MTPVHAPGPATFTLNASAAVQFTATDLQSGNATLGLTGGIGTDVGDARLEIETDLAIVPLAFVRAADGTLSAMHDTVRGAAADGAAGYTYDVPVFNPSSDVTQVSRLRLINSGDASAAVTISGRDDSGAAATGGDVTLTIAAGRCADVDRAATGGGRYHHHGSIGRGHRQVAADGVVGPAAAGSQHRRGQRRLLEQPFNDRGAGCGAGGS